MAVIEDGRVHALVCTQKYAVDRRHAPPVGSTGFSNNDVKVLVGLGAAGMSAGMSGRKNVWSWSRRAPRGVGQSPRMDCPEPVTTP